METFLKINLLFVLIFLFYHLFLEPLKLLKWNRVFLIAGLILSISLPFFHYRVFEEVIVRESIVQEIYEIPSSNIIQDDIQDDIQAKQSINYYELAFYIYILVAMFFSIKMFYGLFQIFRLYKKGKLQKIGAYEVVVNQKIDKPFSFIKIFYPNKPFVYEDYMLKHEAAHIIQFHFIDSLFANIISSLFWINPIVWQLKNKINLNLEYLADETAISQSQDKKAYQLALLNFIQNYSSPSNSLIQAYNQPPILKRIKMMNTNVNKRNFWKFFMILPILTGFFLLFQQEVLAINVFERHKLPEATINKMTINENEKNSKNISVTIKALSNDSQSTILNISENLNSNNNEEPNDISEIHTFRIIKNTSQKVIEEDFEKMSKGFDIKLYMNKICLDKDNIITSISISYDDKKGNKENFAIENNLGIDDVFIKLEKPLKGNAVMYRIYSGKQNHDKKDLVRYLFPEPFSTPPTPPTTPTPPTPSTPPTPPTPPATRVQYMYNMITEVSTDDKDRNSSSEKRAIKAEERTIKAKERAEKTFERDEVSEKQMEEIKKRIEEVDKRLEKRRKLLEQRRKLLDDQKNQRNR